MISMQEQFQGIVFEFVKQVSSIPKIYGIFIFGSVAKGEADARSDVDFLVILDTQQDPNLLNERNIVSNIALDLEKKFNKDIQLVFSNINFDGLDGHFIEEILREGIILFGRAPLIVDKKLGFSPYSLIHYRLTNLSKSDKMKVKRALYGYQTKTHYKGKAYTSYMKGLVSELNGKRTGIASILIPHRKERPVLDTLERFNARISKTIVWLPEVKHEVEFDSNRFASNIDLFMKLQEKNTKQKILAMIKNQTTDLPYDGMPENIRQDVMRLLFALRNEIQDETMRKPCLAILHIISDRTDDVINAKIKELFLNRVYEIFDDLSIEEKNYALDIIQRLERYDPKIIKQLMNDAIEKWTPDEFQNLLASIEFGKLDEGTIEQLRNRLWNWRADAKARNEEEKVNRIDKILELYVFH
jgi:predicted nucleotidyltransferase